MEIVGDGLALRVDRQSKVKTRVSTENTSKIPGKFQEFRRDHRPRFPRHDAMIEVETFDVCQNPKSAYRDAQV